MPKDRQTLMIEARDLKLRSRKTRDQWKVIEEAYACLRREAIRETSPITLRYDGRRTGKVFKSLIRKENLEFDLNTHFALISLIDHAHEIRVWQESLAPKQRNRINHPVEVWRQFKAWRDSELAPSETDLRAVIAEVQVEVSIWQADLTRLPRPNRIRTFARRLTKLALDVERATFAEDEIARTAVAQEFLSTLLGEDHDAMVARRDQAIEALMEKREADRRRRSTRKAALPAAEPPSTEGTEGETVHENEL